jgi:hypothetical protein
MTSDDDRTPLDQLVDQAADLFVYAPIGLFFEAPSLLPKLAAQGRVHARNARLFGQFAVRHGEAELKRRFADLEEQATGLLGLFGLDSDPERAEPGPSGAPAGEARRATGRKGMADNGYEPATGAARSRVRSKRPVAEASVAAEPEAPPSPDVDTLAIPGYESLSASQVVTRLEGLTPGELEAVREYESAHRGRKTILNKVAQLQG